MKYVAIIAMLIASACTTNPTTGAKSVDWNKVIAGIQTGCANKAGIVAATAAAAAAVKLSTDAVGKINDTENLISIGCALLPPVAPPAG